MLHKYLMLILCALNIRTGERCRLNTRLHFGEPLPVILRNEKLLEPNDGYGNVDLENGETITLSCEGGGYLSHPNAAPDRTGFTTASVTCEGGDTFTNHDWLNAPAKFIFFRCSYPPNHMSELTNRTCFDGHPIYEVGYRIQSQFHPLYETCFNEATLNPIYTKYTQKAYNALYQTKVQRPFFIDNNNYPQIPVESLFSPWEQKAAVAQLVGPLIESYFTKTEFLSRGHLAAKTDFVYAFGERATFHYVNCAPQWTGFNGGNWNTLEVDLRNHIHASGYDTVIYTGTFGVTQLSNQFERKVDIYLYTDVNNNPVIPVPQYFYKVVYEPGSARGVAYVGINNPYYTPAEARALFFCEDICRKSNNFRWLSWHPDNPSEGYTFCCTVPDFRDAVRHLPYFEVRGVLT